MIMQSRLIRLLLLVLTTQLPLTAGIEIFNTLESWTNHCFNNLPEYRNPYANSKKNAPESCAKIYPESRIDKTILDDLFEKFTTAFKATTFSTQEQWHGPNAILDNPENITSDTTAPFVRKIKATPGDSVCFMGDLHASVHALLRNLLRLREKGFIDNNWKLANNKYFIFLGDFVDRGAYGLECWCTLMKLFTENPERVILVRGNHEEENTWTRYGFLHELSKKFNSIVPKDNIDKSLDSIELFKQNDLLYKNYMYFCSTLPFAVYLGCGNNNDSNPCFVQCCHGGIEPHYNPTAFLAATDKLYSKIPAAPCTETNNNKDSYHYTGFNWSDFTGVALSTKTIPILTPDAYAQEHQIEKNWAFNTTRLCGYLADIADTNNYLTMFGLSAFFRGHQDQAHSCKIIVQDKEDPVFIKDCFKTTDSNFWENTGITMQHFITDNRPPVFTFTTATEARSLPDEGFGIVELAEEFNDWVIKPHIYEVNRGASGMNEGYVQMTKNNLSEISFSWALATPATSAPSFKKDDLMAAVNNNNITSITSLLQIMPPNTGLSHEDGINPEVY